MSQWLNLGQLATRAGRLLPTITNLTSWLTQPTTDGTTLVNSKGADAELTDVNCLSFDGINDVVDFNHTLIDGQDFVVEWEGVMGAVSNNDAFWSLFDDSVANAGSYIRYEHTNSRILSRMGLTTIISPSITLAENDVIKLTTTVSNSGTRASAVIVVNGVTTNLFTNQLLNAAPEFDGTGRIGRLTPSSTSVFAGKVTSFKITQGEVNVHFPLSEGSGTKLYDVSGNGNHGTIDGATWTTEDGIESWNHEYGFDEDGSVKVPALNTKTKQVATTDGADDEVVFPSAMDFEYNKQYSVTLTFDPTAGTNTCFFASSTASNSRFAISMASGDDTKLVVAVRQASFTTVETPFSSIPSGMITLTASWDGSSTLTASYVDSSGSITNFTSSSEAAITSGTARTTLGCRSSLSSHSIAKYLLLTVTKDNTVLGSYDFQSDIGTTTIQDLSTNDNDGTVTVGSGGLDSFWGQRVTDNDGVLVSADYATGNTSISNPAGFVHNNSECGVKLQSRTVGTFDGVADKVDFDLGTFNTSAFNVKATIKTAGTLQSLGDLFSQAAGTGTGRAWVRINSNGSATTFLGGQGSTVLAPSGTFTASTKYDIELIYNGSNSLQLKTTTGGTTTTHTAVTRTVEESTGAFRFFVGHTGAAPLEGTAFSMEVVGLTKVNFSEAQGTTLTDLSGNDNNGTLTVGSGGTETFWANSYREYPNVLSSYSFIPSNITVTGLSDANANTTYFLSGYGELISGSGFYWTANNGYFIALDDGGPYWAIYNDIGDELSDNTAAGATLLPAEGSWSNSAVIAHSTQGLFIKTSGTNITQIGQYDEDEVLTATEVTRNERYFG